MDRLQCRGPWVVGLTAVLLTACASSPLPPWPEPPRGATTAPAAPAPPGSPAVSAPPALPLALPTPVAPPSVTQAPLPQAVVAPPTPAPYSAAVAARFPAPAQRYDTPGLRRGLFTSNAELSAALTSMVSATPRPGAPSMRLLSFGSSASGTPLMALRVARDDQPRPVVLMVAQQHGDEPAGAEALLVLATELAAGRYSAWLDQIDLVLVPRMNPDATLVGQALLPGSADIGQDLLRLDAPEAQALTGLLRDLDPAVVIDLREYAAVGDALQRVGALPRADVLFEYATVPNLSDFITRASQEWFREPLLKALAAERLGADWYHEFAPTRLDRADNLRNVAGLRNAVGLVVASRGVGLGTLDAQRRVHAQVTALHSLLGSAASRAGDLAKLRRFLGDDLAARACKGDLTIDAAPAQVERRLLLLDPQTGADKAVVVEGDSPLLLTPTRQRARPCGYWIGAAADDAVTRLRAMGLQVDDVAQPVSVLTEQFRERQRTDGALGPSGVFDLSSVLLDLPAGSHYVPLTQPAANLAVAVLEPDLPRVGPAQPPLVPVSALGRVRGMPQLGAPAAGGLPGSPASPGNLAR